jgi:uncharacterized protein (DUF983 family)
MSIVKKRRPNYLWSVLSNRCPRCREGRIFKTQKAYDLKNNIKMHEHCPVCGQPTEIEIGFYYGTGYVSYALCVAFTVVFFVAWYLTIGVSIDDNRLFWWLGIDIALLILTQPLMMRLSRSLWLSWFVNYDPEWDEHEIDEPERIVKEQMNNW